MFGDVGHGMYLRMSSIGDVKRAGRTAMFLGVFWCTGLLVLYLINTKILNHRSFILLPVFGLLAIYLMIGGAIQWMTGTGSIKSRTTGLTPLATVMIQVTLFVLLGVIQHWATVD
jgi:hypothetical protein